MRLNSGGEGLRLTDFKLSLRGMQGVTERNSLNWLFGVCGLSNIANGHPLGLVIPIVPSHAMFSMVETLGRHTTKYTLFHLTVLGKEWTERECAKVSHLLCPVPIVHPIPLYRGRD